MHIRFLNDLSSRRGCLCFRAGCRKVEGRVLLLLLFAGRKPTSLKVRGSEAPGSAGGSSVAIEGVTSPVALTSLGRT